MTQAAEPGREHATGLVEPGHLEPGHLGRTRRTGGPFRPHHDLAAQPLATGHGQQGYRLVGGDRCKDRVERRWPQVRLARWGRQI